MRHREWVAADFPQLKSLHEEWFPVRYPDAYWRQACERHLSLEGWPLLTLTSHAPGNAARIIGCISAVIMDIDACGGLNPATITGRATTDRQAVTPVAPAMPRHATALTSTRRSERWPHDMPLRLHAYCMNRRGRGASDDGCVFENLGRAR